MVSQTAYILVEGILNGDEREISSKGLKRIINSQQILNEEIRGREKLRERRRQEAGVYLVDVSQLLGSQELRAVVVRSLEV